MEKTIQFAFEKETKGTVRYKEEVPENESFVVGTLYIRKDALGDERPQKIEVIIKTVV